MAPQSPPHLRRSLALIGVLVVLIGAGVWFFLNAGGQARQLTVSNAKAVSGGGSMPGFVVTMSLANRGEAVSLVGLESRDAANTHLMGGTLSNTVVPGGGEVSFSMDGAHIMMMGLDVEPSVGQLLPLQITLADGSTLRTQVTVAQADPMDHSQHGSMPGLSLDPAPVIALNARREISGAWVASAEISHFEFDTDKVDREHVPGAGHGHLYLNDVKLGRYFGGDMPIGQLPPGDHRLRLQLNSNLHQPYHASGQALMAEITLREP